MQQGRNRYRTRDTRTAESQPLFPHVAMTVVLPLPPNCKDGAASLACWYCTLQGRRLPPRPTSPLRAAISHSHPAMNTGKKMTIVPLFS